MAKQTAKGGERFKASAHAVQTAEEQTNLADDERQKLLLGRVEDVRAIQRAEGNFDCFGRALNNYCDQRDCLYHAECLSVSMLVGPSFSAAIENAS